MRRVAHTLALPACRMESTGSHHRFEPGPLTRGLRKIVVAFTPGHWRQRLAQRLESNLRRVEELEKEGAWIRRHGSPLRVMGLPEHATLPEVKNRYRDLVFETHPDTAPAAPAEASMSSSTALARRHESEYEILQAAYKMATNPNSLYHRNQSAPALLEDIYDLAPSRFGRRDTQVKAFAYGSWVVGLLAAAVVVFVGFRQGWLGLFQVFDPEFYQYITRREKEDDERRARGEEVPEDPKHYAPLSVKKVLFPGRYIHDEKPTS